MDKMRQKKILYALFTILIFICLLILFYQNIISADRKLHSNGSRMVINFSPEIGEKIVFLNFENETGEIIIKRGFSNYCRHQLSGFEFLPITIEEFHVGDDLAFLEIAGFVGAHGQSRQYFKLNSKLCPQPIAFVKNGNKMYNIYSDQPDFFASDFNLDGYLDISVKYRDYDLDPLVNGVREIYYYSPDLEQFVYNYEEKFNLENCDNCAESAI